MTKLKYVMNTHHHRRKCDDRVNTNLWGQHIRQGVLVAYDTHEEVLQI